MPNIEVHGISDFFLAGVPRREDLMKAFLSCLEDASYKESVVITWCEDHVLDLSGKPQPYLRLVAPEKSATVLLDMEERLQKSGVEMDIEIAHLERFSLKKSNS